MRPLLLILALMIAALFYAMSVSEIKSPPGVLVAEEPRQSEGSGARPWKMGEYTIRPLADFNLRARLLGSESYWFDRESTISPIDLALGWGPMSDQRVLDRLSISQSQRWVRWTAYGRALPITADAINSHSANMHMIPADRETERAMKAARRGQIVTLDGYLVEVSGPRGMKWKSSLSRTDGGQGACELVWVKRFSAR